MKFKVKGLVFVGFAAAILSANAMAANEDKTVTSKAFTEATYQAKTLANNSGKVLQMASNTAGDIGYISIDGTVTENSTNLVTSGAVQAAIEAVETGAGTSYQDRSAAGEAQYVADGNGGWEALTTTATPTQDSTTPFTAGGAYTLDQAKEDVSNKTQTVAATGSTSNDKYPSETAVRAAITAAAGDYQTKSTTAQQVSDGAGGWQALTTTATPSQNSTTPFTAGGAYTLDQAKENVSNKTQSVAATGSTDNDKYPSETAVRAAITAVETAAANAYQDRSVAAEAQYVADGNGGWEALTKDTTVTSGSSNPVTSDAVYNAILDATGGNTIPEKNTNICDATGYAPCALVAESDGLHWYTIATADHAGGVLGDAPANP